MEQDTFLIKTEQKLHTNLQEKGVSKLLGLDYKILYKKGVENKVADALSKKPLMEESRSYALMSSPIPSWITTRRCQSH